MRRVDNHEVPRPVAKHSPLYLLRAATGSVLLFIATVAAVGVFEMRLIGALVFDENLVAEASSSVLDRPLVRNGVSEATSQAIREMAIPAESAAQLKAANLNVSADLQASAALMTKDPQFRTSFSDGLRTWHSYVLTDRSVTPRVDITPFIPQLRADAATVSPLYAQAIADTPVHVPIPTSGLPDLTGLRALIDRTERRVALAALASLVLAFAIYPARARLLRRAGISLCGCAVLHGAAVVLLPVAAGSTSKDSYPIAAEVLRSLVARLIAPAGVLLALGIGVWVIASRWQRSSALREAFAGADAFLAPERPPTGGVDRPAAKPPAGPPAPVRERHDQVRVPSSPAALAEHRSPQAAGRTRDARPHAAAQPHTRDARPHPSAQPHTRDARPHAAAQSHAGAPLPQPAPSTAPPVTPPTAEPPPLLRPTPSAARRPAATIAPPEATSTPPAPAPRPAQLWPDPSKVSRIGAEGDSPAALHALSGLPTNHRDDAAAHRAPDRPHGA